MWTVKSNKKRRKRRKRRRTHYHEEVGYVDDEKNEELRISTKTDDEHGAITRGKTT